METTTFADHNIDVGSHSKGQISTTCPRCSHDRKKPRTKCLSVNLDDGVWNCHHCGWTGSLRKKDYVLPKWENKTELSDTTVEWFLKKNINQQTLIDMRVTEDTQYMPQVNSERKVFCYNYFKDGELVNIKYRDEEKNFKFVKDAELIPYNIDGIKGQKQIFIVEGENDCLTMVQAGYKNTISVPNGANPTKNNLKYLNPEDFRDAEQIFIATDDDEPGNVLAKDLAKFFGRERCRRVKFGGYKDVNEMLCKEGNLSKLDFAEFIQDPNGPLRMTFKYVKKNDKPALTLRGVNLINFGEIFALVGLPGQGKSAICEAIVCAHMGKETFGFKFNTKGKKTLFIDTERPPDDVCDSYHNIARRMVNPKLDANGELDGLVHLALSEFGKVDDLKAILESELSSNEFDLVVLDGILDFSLSMNDDVDATEVVKWVRALAVKYNAAVVTTIHPNKGSETIAGHLGSFLYRWCRAILYVRTVQGDRSIKELTGEPDMAKLSHGDLGTLDPVYFTWDHEARLLTECHYTPTQQRGQLDKMREAFSIVLNGGKRLRRAELIKALTDGGYAKTESTANKWIIKGCEDGLITNTNAIYSNAKE